MYSKEVFTKASTYSSPLFWLVDRNFCASAWSFPFLLKQLFPFALFSRKNQTVVLRIERKIKTGNRTSLVFSSMSINYRNPICSKVIKTRKNCKSRYQSSNPCFSNIIFLWYCDKKFAFLCFCFLFLKLHSTRKILKIFR